MVDFSDARMAPRWRPVRKEMRHRLSTEALANKSKRHRDHHQYEALICS